MPEPYKPSFWFKAFWNGVGAVIFLVGFALYVWWRSQ